MYLITIMTFLLIYLLFFNIKGFWRQLFYSLIVFCLIMPGTMVASTLPEGANVVSGDVSFSQPDPSKLDINQQTDSAIIEWDSFSIGEANHVEFIQPSSSSTALNRVTGASMSNIMGKLTANGRVFLINPNGILFGQNAQVDVGSIMASTHDITNQNFLDKNYVFTAPDEPVGSISNYGSISVAQGGLAAFVAPSVANYGMIQGEMGRVVMAAGDIITIDLYGDDLINLAVNQGDIEQDQLIGGVNGPLVENTGLIEVDGGQVLLTARAAEGVVDNVINNEGFISATSATVDGGKIVLHGGDNGMVMVADSTLDASTTAAGYDGGQIKVLGDKVAIQNSQVLADGPANGGEILIGGNFQGNGPEKNSVLSFVSPGSTLSAKGTIAEGTTDQGDGGRVIVWSDQDTGFFGTLDASGETGGFAEISGKDYLAINPERVDVGGNGGEAGTILLDPRDITVADGGGSAVADVDAFGDTASTDLTIDASTIDGFTGAVVLQANRDIFVNEAIDTTVGNNATTLTLQAGRDVNVTVSITLDGAALSITANDSASAVNTNRTDQTAGDLILTDGITITTGGAGITLTVDSTDDATFTPGALTLGTATLTAGAGSITLDGQSSLTAITGTGNLTSTGLVVTAEGSVNIGSGAGTIVGTIDASGGTPTSFDLDNQGGTLEITGNLVADSGGNITLTATGQTLTVTNALTTSGAGEIFLLGAAMSGAGVLTSATELTLTATGAVNLSGANTVVAIDGSGATPSSFAFTNTAGNLDISGALAADLNSSITFTATGNNITVSNGITTTGTGEITLIGSGISGT
ncbi:MAG: filamentous hemagglutinin N-terminal domain-containing protein, partial [Gammaproteobacteria bacterium]|nr:filamentous hemagglutinin N-terminal domain-containing protein [Gammaproteobacteria bacterium]